MKKNQKFAVSGIALAVTLALGACGGGSSGSSTGTTTTRNTQGVITGFGSVFVNGVEYNIDSSTNVTLDGASGTESALKVGMLVSLQGSVNADGKTGAASTIKFADQMQGVVTANTVAANGVGTLTVMGQTVNVAMDTVFESSVAGVTTATQIQVGNIVEVSGYASSNGSVFATRIEVKAAAQAGAEIEVKGTIANLTATTFTIGSLTVDYSGVTTGASNLANGQYVQVKSTNAYSGTGNFVATVIEAEDDGLKGHQGTEGEDLEVNGVVTAAFDSTTNTFELNGRSVTVDSNTEFDQGSSSSLALNTKIKAETHFDASGGLVADSINFGHEGDLEFGATVEAVDTTAKTLTVMGKTFYVDNNTMMIDSSAAAVRYFSLKDISPTSSDHVEVQAYLDQTSGNLIATKIERGDFSTNVTLKGAVSTTGGLTVEGITVDTSNAGTIPTLADGNIVEIEGTYTARVLYATAVALDN